MPLRTDPTSSIFWNQPTLKPYEKVFTIAMLFYTTHAVFPFITAYFNRGASVGGNPFELALQLFFYAGAFWFIALHWQTVLKGALKAKWILALVLVAICSAAWSQEPVFTLRRCVSLLATTAFGIYFGGRFTVKQQLRLLAWTCLLVEFCSFATVIFLPKYGLDHFIHPGDWQGAFLQKNLLARFMVLSFLVLYFAPASFGRVARWAGMGSAIVLLVFSRSMTGMLIFCAIAATLPMQRLLRARTKVVIPVVLSIAVVAAGVALLLTSSSAEVFQLMHRNSNLTGRTEMWDAVVRTIMKQPIMGYGFNAFWRGINGPSSVVVFEVGWVPLHAHNGFLDLLLDMGLLGLGTFAIGYFALWRRAIALAKKVRGQGPAWLCSYLVFILFYNFTESSILASAGAGCTECSTNSSIFWVLYTATAVSLYLNVSQKPPMHQVAPYLEQDRRTSFAEKTEAASLVTS